MRAFLARSLTVLILVFGILATVRRIGEVTFAGSHLAWWQIVGMIAEFALLAATIVALRGKRERHAFTFAAAQTVCSLVVTATLDYPLALELAHSDRVQADFNLVVGDTAAFIVPSDDNLRFAWRTNNPADAAKVDGWGAMSDAQLALVACASLSAEETRIGLNNMRTIKALGLDGMVDRCETVHRIAQRHARR